MILEEAQKGKEVGLCRKIIKFKYLIINQLEQHGMKKMRNGILRLLMLSLF